MWPALTEIIWCDIKRSVKWICCCQTMFVFQLFVRKVWTGWDLKSNPSSEAFLLGLVDLCSSLSLSGVGLHMAISVYILFFLSLSFTLSSTCRHCIPSHLYLVHRSLNTQLHHIKTHICVFNHDVNTNDKRRYSSLDQGNCFSDQFPVCFELQLVTIVKAGISKQTSGTQRHDCWHQMTTAINQELSQPHTVRLYHT